MTRASEHAKALAKDIVFIIDASLSMGKHFSDFVPNKLLSSVNIVNIAVNKIIHTTKDRIGLIIFNAFVIPLVQPTRDYHKIAQALSLVRKTGEGSAPGDAIIEAVRILRRTIRRKQAIMITDGDLNIGVPLEYALFYAHMSGVETCIVTIGHKEKIPIGKVLGELSEWGFVKWINVENVKEAQVAVLECARSRREPA